jgi:hypothetical protein
LKHLVNLKCSILMPAKLTSQPVNTKMIVVLGSHVGLKPP